MKKSLLGLLVLFALCIASCATAPKSAEVLDGKWIQVGRNVDGVFQEISGSVIYEFSIKKGTLRSTIYGEENEVINEMTSFIRFDGNKIYFSSEKFRPLSIYYYYYFGYFDINSQNVLTIYETNQLIKQRIAMSELWVTIYKDLLTPESYEEAVSSQIDTVFRRYSD